MTDSYMLIRKLSTLSLYHDAACFNDAHIFSKYSFKKKKKYGRQLVCAVSPLASVNNGLWSLPTRNCKHSLPLVKLVFFRQKPTETGWDSYVIKEAISRVSSLYPQRKPRVTPGNKCKGLTWKVIASFNLLRAKLSLTENHLTPDELLRTSLQYIWSFIQTIQELACSVLSLHQKA